MGDSYVMLEPEPDFKLPTLSDIDLENIEECDLKKKLDIYKSASSSVEISAKYEIDLPGGWVLYTNKWFYGETRKYRQEHISRKRFIKLMMSIGYSRNTVTEMADGMAKWSSYVYAWIWFNRLFNIISKEDALRNKGYREIYDKEAGSIG